jgi:hypothetical protein
MTIARKCRTPTLKIMSSGDNASHLELPLR